jgi:hypothetical protein
MTDPADIEAIRALVHRYADAVCRRDQDQWAATWADDSVWYLGQAEVAGKTAIVDSWAKAMDRFVRVVHNALNGEVTAAGDAGSGRWYIMEHYHRADRTPGILLAAYDDTYVRTGAGWRFASRRLDVFYSGAPDLSGQFVPRA